MNREDKLKTYSIVGYLNFNLSKIVNLTYEGNIYAAPGVIKHIIKRHSHELSQTILNDLVNTIKNILSSPDYIGQHPDKSGMEFVKVLDDNIMVTIEIDVNDNYLYVSSLYPIPTSKINRRLRSGRLKQV